MTTPLPPSNKDEIEKLLMAVVLGDEHTTRNKPTKHPKWHMKPISISEAIQIISDLLIQGKIDELSTLMTHVRKPNTFNISGIDITLRIAELQSRLSSKEGNNE